MSIHIESITGSPAASELVVDAVATREGVDPLDLDVPLYDSIDVDDLDSLVATDTEGAPESPVRVTFTYYGYEVTVASDGSVALTDAS